jgi:hypothetical protein
MSSTALSPPQSSGDFAAATVEICAETCEIIPIISRAPDAVGSATITMNRLIARSGNFKRDDPDIELKLDVNHGGVDHDG